MLNFRYFTASKMKISFLSFHYIIPKSSVIHLRKSFILYNYVQYKIMFIYENYPFICTNPFPGAL